MFSGFVFGQKNENKEMIFNENVSFKKSISIGKRTTAELDALDRSDNSVIYTGYNTDLSIEVVDVGNGWEPRIAATNLSDGAYGAITIIGGQWYFTGEVLFSQIGFDQQIESQHLDESVNESLAFALTAVQPTDLTYKKNIQIISGTLNGLESFNAPQWGEPDYGEPNQQIINYVGDQVSEVTISDNGGGIYGYEYHILSDGDYQIDIVPGIGATFKGDPILQGAHTAFYLDGFGRITITEVEDGFFFIECPNCTWYTP